VLILRDVLRWKAAEVAEALGTTTAAVNSALQRAHAQLEKAQVSRDTVAEPTPAQKEMLERYVQAFWDKDIDAIVSMLTQEAVWEMPPFAGWYQGAENIGRLIDTQCPGGMRDMRMLATTANGQPAFGLYMRAPDGDFVPFHLQVLALDGARVDHVVAFFGEGLFDTFGLPDRLPADADSPVPGR
jgi:RNA polymerase sigma-70 factor (ECF subfamily)